MLQCNIQLLNYIYFYTMKGREKKIIFIFINGLINTDLYP